MDIFLHKPFLEGLSTGTMKFGNNKQQNRSVSFKVESKNFGKEHTKSVNNGIGTHGSNQNNNLNPCNQCGCMNHNACYCEVRNGPRCQICNFFGHEAKLCPQRRSLN